AFAQFWTRLGATSSGWESGIDARCAGGGEGINRNRSKKEGRIAQVKAIRSSPQRYPFAEPTGWNRSSGRTTEEMRRPNFSPTLTHSPCAIFWAPTSKSSGSSHDFEN